MLSIYGKNSFIFEYLNLQLSQILKYGSKSIQTKFEKNVENRIAISNSLRPYPNYFKYNLHQVKWAPLPDTSSRKRKTNYKFSCSQFAHQKNQKK